MHLLPLWKLLRTASVPLLVVSGCTLLGLWCLLDPEMVVAAEETMDDHGPWWLLPVGLFLLTLVLGVIAVLAGIGGSVLYVPIVTGFAPWVHIDFVRGAGLMVALTGALSAGPGLLRQGLVNLRLAIPVSLVASCGAIVGALVGLAMPANVVQILLAIAILGMAALMTFAKGDAVPDQGRAEPLAVLLQINGLYRDQATGETVRWQPRRMVPGLVMFVGVGMMAGMFGLGAGWANVPVLNLVMGVPLKIAVATSYFLLAIADTSAAWVYINRGALLPLIAVPSVLGIMLGAKLGARLLVYAKPAFIRRLVIGVLLLAGARSLLRGFGI